MVTRLSGGLTPGDGSDPRTFPAIWNVTADEIEAQGTAISGAESDIDTLEGKNIPAFGTATPSDGQVLTFDSAGSEYVPEDVATTLADLTDTDISSPSSGEVLEYDGTNWVNAAAAGGKILQVVSASHSTNEVTTSPTFVDTPLSLTITPSSASSKIFVTGVVKTRSQKTGTFAGKPNCAIGRDGIVLVVETGRFLSTAATSASMTLELPISLVGIDSPATTSAVTYTWQHKNGDGTTTSFDDSIKGFLIAMEVAV